jgi:hypothetical protein
MLSYLFTVNDIQSKDRVVTAQEVVDGLLGQKAWFFTGQAPLVTALKKGDSVLFYLCGKKRGCFYAYARLSGQLLEIEDDLQLDKLRRELGLNWFKYYMPLVDIEVFLKPVKIKPLVYQLSFIADKKNYGLNLRLPIARLPKEDMNLILDIAHQVT